MIASAVVGSILFQPILIHFHFTSSHDANDHYHLIKAAANYKLIIITRQTYRSKCEQQMFETHSKMIPQIIRICCIRTILYRVLKNKKKYQNIN